MHSQRPAKAPSSPSSSAGQRTTVRCAAFALAALALASTNALAQGGLAEWLKKLPAAGLSEAEAGRGVKEALTQGVTRAVFNLHRTDGFFGSDVYKVLLPPDARRAEQTLRRFGFGAQVDRAVLAINRGAEDAVGAAGPIFTDAITTMSLTDAVGIVRGGPDAATQYFRRKTSDDLVVAFSPPVRVSLEKTHATKYYGDMAHTYNRLPLTSGEIDPDLTSYVVGRAIDALFDQIAREEANIRENPAARTSEILRRVFGAASTATR
jgi:hypothetical protein